MEGANESTELWRHPTNFIFLHELELFSNTWSFLNGYLRSFQTQILQNNLYALAGFKQGLLE